MSPTPAILLVLITRAVGTILSVHRNPDKAVPRDPYRMSIDQGTVVIEYRLRQIADFACDWQVISLPEKFEGRGVMSHVGRRTHRVREVRYCVFYWVSDAVRYVCESCRRCIHANIANKRVCFPRVSGCRPV